jgi:ribosomal protein L37AE/L43A
MTQHQDTPQIRISPARSIAAAREIRRQRLEQLKLENEIEICEENRFSLFIPAGDTEGLRILVNWVRWFSGRGIRAQIERVESEGNIYFAVYRKGMSDHYERIRCDVCGKPTNKRNSAGHDRYLCSYCLTDFDKWLYEK